MRGCKATSSLVQSKKKGEEDSGNVWPRSCIQYYEEPPRAFGEASGKGLNVEDRLKSLMQDLGNAINESLSDSERIAEAIGEIKGAGYDVFLVLEATIGFNKREDGENGEDVNGSAAVEPTEVTSLGKVRFTTQDQRFLKALRIAVDDEAA
jgi:hypothetical protein